MRGINLSICKNPIQKGATSMRSDDVHIVEVLGKTRVVIRSGTVVEVGQPLIKECPLAKRFNQPVLVICPETVKANIEYRISSFGMCTKDRDINSEEDFVVFGASEMISCGIKKGLLDCAVVVCDGAGTMIAATPKLVQGTGGRMSGLVKTSPIRDVIERITANGGKVLDPSMATIDQIKGVAMAHELGFKKVAVTITKPGDAETIRSQYPEVLIFGVHLTGVSKEEAERLVAVCDLVAGCASRSIREVAGRVALLQAGSFVPVFALTRKGKDLVSEKVKETQHRLLIKVEKLPYSGEKYPDPLV
jgi:putative methanogenesis marker protein 8